MKVRWWRRIGIESDERFRPAAILRRAAPPLQPASDENGKHGGNDGCLDARFDFQLLESAVGRVEVAARSPCGLAADYPNRTRRSVPSVDAPLWTAQHVDVLDIEELGKLSGGRVHIDVVVVDRDRRRRVGVEVAEAHAADKEGRVGGREGRSNFQVGCELSDVRQVACAERLELVGIEADDRYFLALQKSRGGRSDHDHLLDPGEGILICRQG